MKKFVILIVSVLLVVISAIGFFACNLGSETEQNTVTNDTPESETETIQENEENNNTVPSEGLEYTLIDNDTSYSVSRGTCDDSAIIIPSIYNGKPVTRIEEYAFSECSSITSIVIPDSVTSIGEGAFYICSSLTSIEIPYSVTSIDLPLSFLCNSLTSITVDSKNEKYQSKNNCLVETENRELILGCKNSIIYSGIKVIGTGAFCGCDLTNLIIPNGVTKIGEGAFYYCRLLTSVVIPDSVTSIETSAFEDCFSLKNITIGNNVTKIGSSAFAWCTSLTSIVIPERVSSIGEEAFASCDKLVEVINKSSLNIVKGSEDNGCVGEYALNIKKSGGSDIVNKNDYLFYTYDGVNYLLGYVGNDKELTLPTNYNGQNYEIYQKAFLFCDLLKSIIIGNNVTKIDDDAFGGCESLTSITYKGTKAQWQTITKIEDWDYSIPTTCKIHCSDGDL